MQVIGPAEMFWMDALSSTLEACAALRPTAIAAPVLGPPTRTEVVQGGRVERRVFSSPHGARLVRLFVPDERPRGLVLMLHGCRQTSENFARATRFDRHASRHGLLAVYPNQARTKNALGCWQWFHPRNQIRGSGEPAILAGLVRALIKSHDLVAAPVFVAGLSAGATMAATMGTLYPDLFTAVGVHSGLPFGAAGDVPGAYAAMAGNGRAASAPLRLPAIVFHGTADTTVHPSNAIRIMAGLAGVAEERKCYRTTMGSERGRHLVRWTLNSVGVADQSELWLVDGAGHAWFGGDGDAPYADPLGPDASAEMLRFYLARAASRPSLQAQEPPTAMKWAA